MNTPAGLVGAGILFWGWQTGLWLFALPIAALLESARLVGWRWEISGTDTRRVADLSRLVLVGMAVYLFAVRGAAPTVLGLIQWFPLAVLLLVFCQTYGARPSVDLRTFFLLLRRRRIGADPPLDVGYPYLVLCVAGASAANVRTAVFYVGLCLLAAWALWPVRSRAVPWRVWGALLAGAAVLGYAGHVGLHALQGVVEAFVTEWVVDAAGRDRDPFRNHTALGSIGRLKLSDRILLRVDTGGPLAAPLLLHEASYDVYNMSVWGATAAEFGPVPPARDRRTWNLQADAVPTSGVTVSAYLRRGRGMVPLPEGTVRIEGLLALQMKRNRLGAVKVEDSLGLVSYTARIAPARALGVPPADTDLQLPKQEAPLLARIAGELGLAGRPPRDAVVIVRHYFRGGFQYSMDLEASAASGRTALEDFLLRTRTGHCEYFATGAVLLLRAAGIPARYAVGFAVSEWSPREGRYLVRARHAHSWAQAWVDGAWRDVDTTPPGWVSSEASSAAVWAPLADLVSWVIFAFSRWRWSEGETLYVGFLAWLLVPLVGLLAWRLYSRRRVARGFARPAPLPSRLVRPGADSELYLIEARLAALGLGRRPWEPAGGWLDRLRATPAAGVAPEALSALNALVRLHYRYRFDPDGLAPAERETLRSGARAWLERVGPA